MYVGHVICPDVDLSIGPQLGHMDENWQISPFLFIHILCRCQNFDSFIRYILT